MNIGLVFAAIAHRIRENRLSLELPVHSMCWLPLKGVTVDSHRPW